MPSFEPSLCLCLCRGPVPMRARTGAVAALLTRAPHHRHVAVIQTHNARLVSAGGPYRDPDEPPDIDEA